MTFTLLPAIDLRAGRVVRLVRGDFASETVYGDDPVAVATGFADGGAAGLHVVDLDGARSGAAVNAEAIARIVETVGDRLLVEVAGGIRDARRAAELLALGAGRVVVGTAALADPEFARDLVDRHGTGSVAVALDVRDGLAVGGAWAAGASGFPVLEALERLADAGVAVFEVTAIARDGTFEGPDLALLGDCVGARRGAVIASGGIASGPDLRAVRDLGCAGAIVGRALYEGRLTLAEALAALE